MKEVLSVSPWFGSAGDIAPLIVSQFGKCDTLFVVCAGGMSEVLAAAPVRREVVNDLHADLINFCRVLVSPKFNQLDEMLCRTMFVEAIFNEGVEYLSAHSDDPPAPTIREVTDEHVYRAYYTFITWWMGKGGMAGTDGKPSLSRRYTGKGGSGGSRFASATRQLIDFRERLSRVEFWCMDMFAMLEKIDDKSDTVIYIDPPFIKGGHHYKHTLNTNPDDVMLLKDDYDRLERLLRRFKKARVVLRHYDHPRIRGMFPKWSGWPILTEEKAKVTTSLQATRHKNTSNQSTKKRGKKVDVMVREMLWINGAILKWRVTTPLRVEYNGKSGHYTHLPVMVEVLLQTQGRVLEMGAGYYSTPTLARLCGVLGRELVTVETNQRWQEVVAPLLAPPHSLMAVKHYNAARIKGDFGFVLLDHCPGYQRRVDIERVRSHANVIMVHAAGEEGFKSAVEGFRFFRWITHLRPWITAVMSDHTDVRTMDIFEPNIHA